MENMADIAVVGMGVMGRNLALNMADHGFVVGAYNRTAELMKRIVQEHPHKNMHPFYNLQELLAALKKPRRVFLMIAAGDPVDWAIEQIVPHLDPGDIILDGGNSFFEDTRRRHAALTEKGIHYFGVGVSGGEKGARFGPAIMPGGDAEAYGAVQPILDAIAAKAEDGAPCCTYIGSDGAGHYVKMVHNGIEYADMQLITEAYLLLKHVGGYDNARLSEIFHAWNQGELRSYLIGITADIFAEKDELTGGALVDMIVDRAGQKGTGRWTSLEALYRGVDLSMISAACSTRVLSNLTEERTHAAAVMDTPAGGESPGDEFVEAVRKSLYAAKIVAYAQGFSLYRAAKEQFGWALDFGKIASIFRAGCIIQAEFLTRITEAYQSNEELQNLMFDPYFLERINRNQKSLRDVVCLAVQRGVPIPAFAAALQYIDAYRSRQLGANLIQAQRDYFGAHTYERIDRDGSFHHEWKEHYRS